MIQKIGKKNKTRAVFLVGVPGCGKSVLVRSLLPMLGEQGERFTYGLIFGETYPEQKVLVLGTYDPKEVFPGTDRISMAMQKDAEGFFLHMNEHWNDWKIFGEGGRISTGSFWSVASKYANCHAIFLSVSSDEGEKRREERGQQNEKWVKGRITQLENLYGKFKDVFPCDTWENETQQQLQENSKKLFEMLK